MMKPYQTLRRGCQLGLAAALLLAGKASAQNTLNYIPVNSTNITGTFTDLSTVAGSTVIMTGNNDDANSAAQPIGFTFNYNGTGFTQFVLNTNGLMRLGASAPSSAIATSIYAQEPEVGPVNSLNTADTNLLMPFNFDLEPGTGTPEFRVATTGASPNRICTIQWKNMADKAAPANDTDPTLIGNQIANFSFQVKLYETTNQIDFVYSAAAIGGATELKYAVVGIKGSGYELGRNVLFTKQSMQAWSLASSLTGPQLDPGSANAFNFRSVALPDAGRTLRFTAAACVTTPITTFPYTENFDASTTPGVYSCGATALDGNQDLLSWFKLGDGTTVYSSSAPNSLVVESNGGTANNDWYFTPPLQLRAGYSYQLQFKYRGFSTAAAEAIEVKAGTAATPAGQTLTLFSNANITSTSYVTTGKTTDIVPAANGVYFIGFHSTSTAGQVTFIDDIVVTETRTLAVKNGANSLFSAEASPVPFGSNLNLNLNTREAGALHLTVRDALGRTLRQTTATTTVGTSTIAVPGVAELPAGVYFLDVEQAGQKQVLRVTHE